jgi:hypothetical protein
MDTTTRSSTIVNPPLRFWRVMMLFIDSAFLRESPAFGASRQRGESRPRPRCSNAGALRRVRFQLCAGVVAGRRHATADLPDARVLESGLGAVKERLTPSARGQGSDA